MKYDVICAPTREHLVTLVNARFRAGWQLVGGVAVSLSVYGGATQIEYAQAMVKVAE